MTFDANVNGLRDGGTLTYKRTALGTEDVAKNVPFHPWFLVLCPRDIGADGSIAAFRRLFENIPPSPVDVEATVDITAYKMI